MDRRDFIRTGIGAAATIVTAGGAATPLRALGQQTTVTPTNAVRSVMRQFTSDVLDTAWFNDREMWPRYLSMVAGHGFNRLHLAFGLGYDSLQRVTDSYLLFLYPFLVDVPGYRVTVTNVSTAERDANLATLKFISEQTVAHGLAFQLGIWMHGYELIDSPDARHVVQGLDKESHAAYCRDALTTVLRACPAISAVALRIHGESGVAEGNYDFWGTVFDGVPKAGRQTEIDLHAKGLDHRMIDRALATGMPVNVSPKYWAEHLGMPYHQAAIRENEMPVAGRTGAGLMTLSEGSLSFTRYGYADFLRDDRRYTVRHRVFAGTQRLLLAADPVAAAAYSRAFQFCGSTGMDLMEPLTCRGRRGTGVPGTRRSGYRDARLEPRYDWEKYEDWYRTWGRLARDASDAAGAPPQAPLASSLAHASRVLPIVTTAYTPSAACDAYWPEIYWNQPMVAEPRPNPYGDTLAPKTFQNASPLDPQLFSSMNECARALIAKQADAKYSPIEVAQWLEDLAARIDADLAKAGAPATLADERTAIDVRIQAGLARFFAAKFRAGVLYALHEATGDRRPLEAALARYDTARTAWADVIAITRDVYADDLSASDKLTERGQWTDRLAGIDADIEQMRARLAAAGAEGGGAAANGAGRRDADVASAAGAAATGAEGAGGAANGAGRRDADVPFAIAVALGRPGRRLTACTHEPPASFTPGAAVRLIVTPVSGRTLSSVQCFYRHVDQAERFESAPMTAASGGFATEIPAAYTQSPYPLQYYFVVTDSAGAASLYPGLGESLMAQPYFVLRRA